MLGAGQRYDETQWLRAIARTVRTYLEGKQLQMPVRLHQCHGVTCSIGLTVKQLEHLLLHWGCLQSELKPWAYRYIHIAPACSVHMYVGLLFRASRTRRASTPPGIVPNSSTDRTHMSRWKGRLYGKLKKNNTAAGHTKIMQMYMIPLERYWQCLLTIVQPRWCSSRTVMHASISAAAVTADQDNQAGGRKKPYRTEPTTVFYVQYKPPAGCLSRHRTHQRITSYIRC